jgi:uncharacterized protein (TIGR02391 family)
MPDDELKMTFDPNTIEHLGVRMYSTLPPVLAELIANAYDADAGHVSVVLKDGDEKEIEIEDDGAGMSFGEINSKFLRIGRPRRQEDGDEPTGKKRKVIGKKGLGKLSFFGIAHEIEIETKKDGKRNVFSMSWDEIKKEKGEYKPTVVVKDENCAAEAHGTKITLKKIQRTSDFLPEEIANSISKIFIIDPDFEITVRHNSDKPIVIANDRRYAGLEKDIEWEIPADSGYKDDYEKAGQITGHLIATKKPIPPKTNMRGVVLFSRKKLVNLPEYFSDSTSSHFFSYLTGWLEVDFIDDLDEDVISTNRQSLNWGHPEMQKLREHLRGLMNWLERDWRKKREEKRGKELTQATGINVPDWFSKLPDDVRAKIEPVIGIIMKDAELSSETNQDAVRKIHEIIPEYPSYHWRHLHPEIQDVSKTYYVSQNYYTALFEAVKKYLNAVKSKTGSALNDNTLLENVFALKNPKLSVTDKFKKPDGTNFKPDTIENIAGGHRMLALGIWAACRCPIAHEEVADLKNSGLFTEKDCLDALSLLSHLWYRLDNSVPVSASTPTAPTP